MQYYGNHWTSEDATELQTRIELESLNLWARSCPRGGEWTAWRRLDVVRAENGVLREIVEKALHADQADNATNAAYAQSANHALRADESSHAASADHASNATKAQKADLATRAETATTAESANRLGEPVIIAIAGAVTGQAAFDGQHDITIQTAPGSDFASMKNDLAELQRLINSLSSQLGNQNSSISGLSNQLADLAKRVTALEAAVAKGPDMSAYEGKLRDFESRIGNLENLHRSDERNEN